MTSKITVAAYFPFDGNIYTDSTGNAITADWNWALQQFDRVAQAGAAVRSVVFEQSYVFGMPDPAIPSPNEPNATDVRSKMQQCRAAGQLVYGYVACEGGAIPLNPPEDVDTSWWQVNRDWSGDKWWTPLIASTAPVANQGYPNTNHSYPCLKEQIDDWYQLYPELIDGIYLDQGPTDCLDPQTLGYADIPANYMDYCNYVHGHSAPGAPGSARLYVLAAQYGDVDKNRPGWFEQLPIDEVAVWEQSVSHYLQYFSADDFCTFDANGNPVSVPPPQWWDPGAAKRADRVHIINGGVHTQAAATGKTDAQVVSDLITMANARGADTLFVTEAGHGPHGSVYAFLPPYWDDEVALCTPSS